MIHFTRTSSIVPGKVAEAMAFAHEMTEYLRTVHDQKMQLLLPVGGNPHRICWSTTFSGLGEMEQFQARTLSDPKYLTILGKAASLFIPGTAHDDIWRSL